MKVGWIGLGKLGLPCALVMAKAGHEVCGTDTNLEVARYLSEGQIPYREEGVAEAFREGHVVTWKESVADVLAASEIVFVAVQTPHAPEYEGCNTTPETSRDFDYSYLATALREIAREVARDTTVVVVSTVNPGTSSRIIEPILRRNSLVRYVYSPAFIAMGTTMADFSKPEMVIAGTNDDLAFSNLSSIHESIHNAPIIRLGISSCELVKMSYNTFIGMKIVFANTIGEISEKIGADADEVTEALAYATQRILSPKYLRSGMGDGGGCHPRDQLALSWLAERLDLSVDLFGFLMRARDAQEEWHAQLCLDASKLTGLPIRVCGREFKAESNLTTGSPSRLLMSLLSDSATWQDERPESDSPAVFFIGVNHEHYRDWVWPQGSVVIDPWGYIPDQSGVVVRRLGRQT